MEAVRDDRNKEIIRFNIIAIAVNLVLATAKITVGTIARSAAVTLDGVNSMADMISSALILVFARLSDKKADKDHPFGFGRLEYLCSMIVTMLVMGIGLKSMFDAIKEILYPGEAPNFSFLVVAVEVVSMAVKFYLGKKQQDAGRRLNSQAMIMAGIDAMSDVGIGAAVLISIVVYKAFGIDIEDYLCVIIAALILKAGVEMLIESMNKIVGAPADPDFRKKITTMLFKEKDVYNVSSLVIHNYGENNYIGSVDIEVDEDMKASRITELSQHLKDEAKELGMTLTSVGISGIKIDQPEADKIYDKILPIVMKHEDISRIQSFRVSFRRKKISFALVYKYDAKDPEADMEALKKEIQKLYPGLRPFVLHYLEVNTTHVPSLAIHLSASMRYQM